MNITKLDIIKRAAKIAQSEGVDLTLESVVVKQQYFDQAASILTYEVVMGDNLVLVAGDELKSFRVAA